MPASSGLLLEISSFIAMIVYALVAFAAAKLVEVIFGYRPRGAVMDVTGSTRSEHYIR